MTRSKGRTGRPYRRLQEAVRRSEPYCWICGKLIDPTIAWPDPMSFTLDHKIPISRGGSPLDRTNAAAAHAWCNTSKGDGVRKKDPTSRRWTNG